MPDRLTSFMTIEANTRLSGLKFAVGFASHSQAVVSEAANNLGDALGSFVTIIGTRLPQKKMDQRHRCSPYSLCRH
ncbi:cation transporter [Erysipelotrichaceae bacterium 51-3]